MDFLFRLRNAQKDESFLSGELTFGAAQSHDQRAVALVQLPEAGAAGPVSDDGQLSEDQRLHAEKREGEKTAPFKSVSRRSEREKGKRNIKHSLEMSKKPTVLPLPSDLALLALFFYYI